jgi:uncharacterized protein YdeI (YjbR/CyaY-like superfamily)
MKMTKSIDVFLADGCGRCSKFATDACTVRVYAAEIEALRSIALSVFEEETMKWGGPCYSYKGKNVAMIFSFKDNCGFSFFKGPLLADTHQMLVAPSETAQTFRMLRFTNLAQILEKQDEIRSYLFEALEVEKAGLKLKPTPVTEFPVPEELQAQFDAAPEFETAFRALTPGRQKNYLRHFNDAKQSATRSARIEKYKPFIFKGIGQDEAWKFN